MGKSLMIVDDSRFIYEEMKHLLADSEFEIVGYCKDGEEALEQYEKLRPDVVTMDIILPGIDGLDATQALIEKWPDARVVVVSSLAYDDTIERAQQVGALGFIFKPLEKDKMLEVLKKATS